MAYLIQEGSNCVFVATPELAGRSDMRPYDPANPVLIIKKEAGIENKVISDSETLASTPISEPKEGAFEIPSNKDIRAGLEAIEDPEQMISHVFKKYGIKLTKTMKKSTMIDRVVNAARETPEC